MRRCLAPPLDREPQNIYSIWPHDEKAKWASVLERGLLKLGTDFNAVICPVCKGEGEYPQTFTAGCGGGYFKSMSSCDYCNGRGLMQHTHPAPRSVVQQVITAAGEDYERIR